MKTLQILAILIIGFAMGALTMYEDVQINQRDCNFNGNYTLTIKGVNLIIQGNINGTGTITSFCNNNIANICGTLQPNSGVTLTNITYCGSPLSIKTFDITYS